MSQNPPPVHPSPPTVIADRGSTPPEAPPAPPGAAAPPAAVAPVTGGDADAALAGVVRRRRFRAMVVFAAAFAVGWLTIGLPTDPIYAFVWLWAATIAWTWGRPWREHLRFGRDWLPVLALLVVYNISRGFADNGVTPHARALVDADREMWGWATGGQVPTVWLQRHLYDPAAVHWWDVLASFVYFSHFVVSLVVAVVLYLRERARWAAYLRRFFFLSGAGLATYFLYPAAPPWWAAEQGLLPPVARISTRGWHEIGMHGAANMLNAGQLAANKIAAMPSLHTAFALFVVAFLAPGVRRRWWPLLFAYPLAMTLTLVYAGEHYMIDVLMGWVYVVLTFQAVGLGEQWRARRPARARPAPPPAQPEGLPQAAQLD